MENNEVITPQNVKEAFEEITKVTRRFAEFLTDKEWLGLLERIVPTQPMHIWFYKEALLLLVLSSKEKFKNKKLNDLGIEKFILGSHLISIKSTLLRIERGLAIPFIHIPNRLQGEDTMIKNILTYRLQVGK